MIQIGTRIGYYRAHINRYTYAEVEGIEENKLYMKQKIRVGNGHVVDRYIEDKEMVLTYSKRPDPNWLDGTKMSIIIKNKKTA